MLSEEFYERAKEIVARYPVARSALLMLLHEAQDEVGYITDDVIREVAKFCDLSSADVAGVVTFYTMYKREHPGRYLISLCTNSGCAFFGAEEAAGKLGAVVGPPHKATEDGLMSWEEVECLAFCGAAPAAQVNYRDVPNLTAERAERLCDALRAGRELDDVLDELRADAKLPPVSSAGVESA
jgi:NADH-quinone oxidoreductase subunit E